MNLMIVESPAKAKTIARYLGGGTSVMASGGHIKDLPEKEIGVDVERNFEPEYVLIPDEKKRGNRERVEHMRRAARQAEEVYLATDPDREGEMISQHLWEEVARGKSKVYRLTFHEVTRPAIEQALQLKGKINQNLVAAQKARRIIDRLLGYSVSPWLSERLQIRGLSAGRVQSVVLRFVVERFHEIQNFNPVTYWTVNGLFQTVRGEVFRARLHSIRGWVIKTSDFEVVREGEIHLVSEEDARKIVEYSRKINEWKIGKKEVKRKTVSSPAPLTTSTMQQAGVKILGLSVERIMELAQQLYEGIELSDGRVGLITYPRTDATRLAETAVKEIRDFIVKTYGTEYVTSVAPAHRGQKGAQEAHEAIRPTSIERHPYTLDGIIPDEMLGLYTLIWQRAVASQMSPAQIELTSVEVHGEELLVFRGNGNVVLFPGYRRLEEEMKEWTEKIKKNMGKVDGETDNGRKQKTEKGDNIKGKEDGEKEGEGNRLPFIAEGEPVHCMELAPEKHQTQPPRPYTEATLVKKMEVTGIGRPSTYAQILKTLQTRNYVICQRGNFEPTPLGCEVVDILTRTFPDIFCPEYTAQMERELDEIAEGKKTWQPVVKSFYERLQKQMRQVPGWRENEGKCREESAEETKEKKRDNLWEKNNENRKGSEENIRKTNKERDHGRGNGKREATSAPSCPKCQGPMQLRESQWGVFWGCRAYPACRGIRRVEAK